jgi:hypothetical protein
MMHARAAAIMKEFDKMPRRVRDCINEGQPIPSRSKQSQRFRRYVEAHYKRPSLAMKAG